jgi:Ras-related protein Rab-8A
MSTIYDYQIKILMIGNSCVGKTSVLIRFTNNNFSPTFITTIGIDFKIKSLTIGDKKIKLQIWDTAGQERFRTITKSYFRSAQGVILVYDITDKTSFMSIRNWIEQIQLHSESNVNKILVGNKCDCIGQRVVSYEEGLELAKDYKIDFIECSAKSDININSIFTTITEQVVKRLESEYEFNKMKRNTSIILNKPTIKKKKCC